MADLYFCPWDTCPYFKTNGEAFMEEFPGRCPYCDSELEEEKWTKKWR